MFWHLSEGIKTLRSLRKDRKIYKFSLNSMEKVNITYWGIILSAHYII